MTNIEKQFVNLIKSVVSKGKTPIITNWNEIWNLAKRNHLEAIIWEIAKVDSTVPQSIKTEMYEVYNQMLARTIRQECCFNSIANALIQSKVHFAPLKGSVLKKDYPEPYLRFMSDLDYYIKPEDRPIIRKAMKTIDGTIKGTESGDDQFIFWNSIGVEFHGRLLYRKTKTGIEKYSDWKFVDEKNNQLTEEGYALNLIGHAVNDMSCSGTGIRYILDLWMYKHNHQPQPDWDSVYSRLKHDGIYKASKNLMLLSEYLFGCGKETPLMIEMADYVVKGGLYGDYKRGLVSQAAFGNATFRQLFRSRAEFENRYPWLKKLPFLLPIAWALRLIHSLKSHKHIIKKWHRDMKRVSSSEAKKQKQRLQRFGF